MQALGTLQVLNQVPIFAPWIQSESEMVHKGRKNDNSLLTFFGLRKKGFMVLAWKKYHKKREYTK